MNSQIIITDMRPHCDHHKDWTLRVKMMHHHDKFASERLSGSEYTIRTNLGLAEAYGHCDSQI